MGKGWWDGSCTQSSPAKAWMDRPLIEPGGCWGGSSMALPGSDEDDGGGGGGGGADIACSFVVVCGEGRRLGGA